MLKPKSVNKSLLVLNVGLLDGLLGVGMMTLLVMTGIIPENSLRLAPVRVAPESVDLPFFGGCFITATARPKARSKVRTNEGRRFLWAASSLT